MTYKRPKLETPLTKAEKVQLMTEYLKYYEKLINENGLETLNVKIPREVFKSTLDKIGSLLNDESRLLLTNNKDLKKFLKENQLPASMSRLITDDFRVFCLLLNAFKQWVSAESAATDRYLLGGTARQTCRSAVSKCIVTGGELGGNPELHHPLRDGRPPILISKEGHNAIEQQKQNIRDILDENDYILWKIIEKIRKKMSKSWTQLREGCNAIVNGTKCRPGAKTFANTCIRETGLTAAEILLLLDSIGK